MIYLFVIPQHVKLVVVVIIKLQGIAVGFDRPQGNLQSNDRYDAKSIAAQVKRLGIPQSKHIIAS